MKGENTWKEKLYQDIGIQKQVCWNSLITDKNIDMILCYLPLYYHQGGIIMKINFIDIFAGAGGLSEGFIREGFQPVAFVEKDKDACHTL